MSHIEQPSEQLHEECNHFHYSANGGVDSLDLWYSEEENAICQIDLTRSDAKDTVRLQVTTYLDSFMPEVSLFSDFHGDEDQWNCATTSRRPWLHHGEGLLSDSAAPTSETAGAITEALGMLGLLSSQATAVVSSLSWDEALSMRTSSSGMVLKRQDRAPPCCLTDGLQAESGMASPLVRSFDEMTGVCLSDGYYRHENAGPGPSTSVDDFVNDDVMSPLLKTFGFTFESTHPLKGYPEGYGGGHGAVPGSGSRTAQKYTFFIAPEKRVDVFVDEDHTLAYLELTDLNRDVATGVHANSWITAPLSEELFEVGEDWQCEQELPDAWKQMQELGLWNPFLEEDPVPGPLCHNPVSFAISQQPDLKAELGSWRLEMEAMVPSERQSMMSEYGPSPSFECETEKHVHSPPPPPPPPPMVSGEDVFTELQNLPMGVMPLQESQISTVPVLSEHTNHIIEDIDADE
eukprot:g33162.t1